MKTRYLLIGLLLLAGSLCAQGVKPGSVVVHQDPLVDTLLIKYGILRNQIMKVEDNKGIPGYRIQVYFDSGINSSERARKARDDFQALYPDIAGYITWKAPNYRVRVGDFRTRLEAENALRLILLAYPNAWVIKDEINYPPIL